MSAVKTLVDGKISGNKVMVFSKSYCPFCTKAKKALESLNLGSDLEVMEIENRSDCDEIQDYLLKVTGGRSVSLPSYKSIKTQIFQSHSMKKVLT